MLNLSLSRSSLLALFFVAPWTVTRAFPQSGPLRFERLALEKVQSRSMGTTFQDSHGYLWLGTNKGLSRYDGYGFRHFRHDPTDPESLAHDVITAICEDDQGNLWVGTRGGFCKLVFRNSKTRVFVNYPRGGKGAMPSKRVAALVIDNQGFLWIGTDKGLSRFDRNSEEIQHYRRNANHPLGLSHDDVSSLLEDHEGVLWIGTTGGGLNRLNKARTRLDSFLNWNRREALRYGDTVTQLLETLAEVPPLITLATHQGGATTSKPLSLKTQKKCLVVAVGEGRGSLVDFGTIRQGDLALWSMDYQQTRHAGGHIKNRVQVAVLDLPAGDYRIELHANGSHAPDNWDEQGPDYPELWGMRIYELPAPRTDAIAASLSDYRIPSQIASGFISTIYEDRSNRLWIGTQGNGLCLLDEARENFVPYGRRHASQIRTYPSMVRAQFETLHRGREPLAEISQPEDNQNLERVFQVKKATDVLMVFQGEEVDGRLTDYGWLERNGKRVWQPVAGSTTHAGGRLNNRLQYHMATLKPGKYSLHFISNDFYSPGNWGARPPDAPELWGMRLWEVSPTEARFFSEYLQPQHYEIPNDLAENFITSLTQDFQGDLWIGTNKGLSRLTPRSGAVSTYKYQTFLPESLSENRITSLMTDRSGTVWIGTSSTGLNKYDPYHNRFRKFTQNPLGGITLPHRSVLSFYEDLQGNIYVGTMTGIALFNRKNGQFAENTYHANLFSRLQKAQVLVMLEDSNGNLWIGTDREGLLRTRAKLPKPVDPALFESELAIGEEPEVTQYTARFDDDTTLASKRVTALLETHNGTLWIGTSFGLHRYDPESDSFIRIFHDTFISTSPSDDMVTALCQDPQNRVWVGTESGLNLYQPDTNQFKRFLHDPDDASSLSSQKIVSLLGDKTGHLWVGTYDGGLNKLDPDKALAQHFTEQDGLPDNMVLGLLDDRRGGLWISSGNGLARLDKSSGEIKTYVEEDGLIDGEFSQGACLLLRNGEMAFGGINGFNLFHPRGVGPNLNPPKVVLTAVKKRFDEEMTFDRPLNSVDTITLPYEDNFVAFEFAAIDYTNPVENRFTYRLEGMDPNWIDGEKRRYAGYPNLDPGPYTFKVKAINSDGIESEEMASVKLRILRPFWSRWWFVSLMIASFVGLIFLGYRYRIRQLRRENELQEEFSKRLIQSQEGERRRIAHELHDSLSQNLLVINNEIQHQIKVTEKEGRENHLDGLSVMILDSINEVRNIAYHLHPHQLERLGLKRAIESVINNMDGATEIDFVLRNAEVDGRFSKDVEINIYRIIQEAINNIVKHADTAEALVDLKCGERHLDIRIQDYGKGFDMKSTNTERGIGLTGMRERVKLIGGTLRIKSEPEEGTTLDIRIPL